MDSRCNLFSQVYSTDKKQKGPHGEIMAEIQLPEQGQPGDSESFGE